MAEFIEWELPGYGGQGDQSVGFAEGVKISVEDSKNVDAKDVRA